MKSDSQLIEDMLDSIIAIESYKVSSFEDFVGDDKTQDAIMYNLIILGEAANRINESFQEQHPDIPWSSIIGTRNIIVHGYDQVKLQIVWDILQKDLLTLKSKLAQI